MPSVLDKPYFRDEAEAYAKVESIVWPNGPVRVHCGETGRIGLLKGKATRPGVYEVLCLPETVPGHGQHRVRGQPHSPAGLAQSGLPHGFQQEGRFQQPASPDH